ncbi:transglutaminase-like domain-containing protein [Ruminococcus sp.]|uniref:transglutaminase domain-containing protein n=1 Tax=Ruminococcus sp. TaxID=41978 RepID=UPI0025F9761D|nr:transglutaminase-like domain-containing protein [Ruminococcus sp.]MBQ8965325.1 transglutaminase domain-containing protein [Ruminococcus sp.]
MKFKRFAAALTAMVMAAAPLGGCSDMSKTEESSRKEASDSAAEKADTAEFPFEVEDHQIEVGGKKYQVFDREIRFNYADVPYEEWLSYKSPFDEYVPLLLNYDDGIEDPDIYDLETTAAYAIRYAYENGIEEIEFPVEFGDMTMAGGWEFAGLCFPNVPLAAENCNYELTDEGYYRIHLAESVLKAASHNDEVIAAAKEVIESMPEDCDTDAEKAYFLYDWVCRNIAYDEFHAENTGAVNNEPQSLYGALVKKRAVCDGIACAVQLLFNMAGIECGKVDALPLSSEEDGHVWNYAYIDDEVWDFDATWDIYRFYESDDDEITDYDFDGLYEWFGTSRTEKSTMFNINDSCLWTAAPTTDAYTEKSPANVIFDYVMHTDPDTYDLTTYHNGEKVENLSLDDLKKELEENGRITLGYDNNMMLLADFAYIETAEPMFEGIENDELIQNLDVYSNFMILAK